jgi:hypothetical protein
VSHQLGDDYYRQDGPPSRAWFGALAHVQLSFAGQCWTSRLSCGVGNTAAAFGIPRRPVLE